MASEGIVETSSSNSQGSSSGTSTIEVGYKLTIDEANLSDLSLARIFRVPKSLRDSSDNSYRPYLVSIGPFHYGKEELKHMEEFKSEAVRRMQKRIQRRDPCASIKSIVEGFVLPKHKEIRKFYGEHFLQFTAIELAWMVTRDACFIFEFLVNYLEKGLRDQPLYQEKVAEFGWMYDPVFDAAFQNPLTGKLMDDIFLFENQLPLWVLQHLQVQMDGTDGTNLNLDDLIGLMLMGVVRHTIFLWYVQYGFSECCEHLLEALYTGMVGRTELYFSREAVPLKASSRNRMQIFFDKVVESGKGIYRRWRSLPSNTNSDELNSILLLKLPTAVELKRRGVKIFPVTKENAKKKSDELKEGFPAIMFIKFDEKTSTLYLPEVTLTPESNSVIRNFIAMELSLKEKYNPRPMTQFALFMDELIDSEEDVAVLRKAEVIHNFYGSNVQVADHFNSLTKGIAPYSGCKVIDDVRIGLHKYTKRKYKILWSEFMRVYFSKPWLLAGYIGAVLLLLMTVTQVVCLFVSCQPHDS
ncbi:hypothetical protein SUGI_1084510 [Cryptomeria japonica]|uniref:UPF0481 protein At3g47200 n=1 Tax=Cryptomeria japonica TaxID=3369 RepID=UPI0024149DF6|nr:UPF0481 protein At3g47200 [Cryptomeria japonica]GLJ50929.1 hypothetical protein SUGI_1084510 [Cryptomeria japonica]